MTALARNRPATYADIEALPATMVGQILFGMLHAHPRPAPRYARASSRLGAELDGPFDRGRGGPGGWIILDEPELHLDPHVVVPDIAAWRRVRLWVTRHGVHRDGTRLGLRGAVAVQSPYRPHGQARHLR